jgi:tetratricopeptide (TPR) repeat protein
VERDRGLDAARGAGAFFALILVFVLGCGDARAQCAAAPEPSPVQALFEQQDWAGVVRAAGAMRARSADANFDYGMALAHLGRLSEARNALLSGARECPGEKRFPIELGGVAFEQKRYGEAAHWLRRGQRLDPRDAYANNFLGTVYFLLGNLAAAVRFWNRVGKPEIAGLDFDPHLRVHRLLLDRAFAFSPAAVLRERQLATTETRLEGLGIFPGYNLHLEGRPDGRFDAMFRAQERDGFGSSTAAALVSTLGGAPYATVYPSYANIGRAAMNFEGLVRWDAQKRRAWGVLSAPLEGRPEWRWQVATDLRNENWAVRRSFTGTAPVLGSFNLEREAGGATLTSLESGAWQWSLGGELSHRIFRDVVPGSALTTSLVTPGWELQQTATVTAGLIRAPEYRFTVTAGAASELGRMFSTPSRGTEKLQGWALANWLPGMEGDRYELTERVRAGKIFGSAPFDDWFVFGMDRDDTDLWMRGHLATRDGRKGSSPVGDGYFLSNTDALWRVNGNGLVSIHVGPLLDVGKMAAPTAGLSTREWLVDTGIEARVTVLHTSVVLSWGRDLRTGANAFFGTVGAEGRE